MRYVSYRIAGLLLGLALVAATGTANAQQANYVYVQNGRLMLNGRQYIAKGINYFGGWRVQTTIPADATHSLWTMPAFLEQFDATALNTELAFLKNTLNMTTIRIGMLSKEGMQNLIDYHSYTSPYLADGTVNPVYLAKVQNFAQMALANGLRIHFTLLWDVEPAIQDDFLHTGALYAPGGTMDVFYSHFVTSLAAGLSNYPGVMSYEIGCEALLRADENWGGLTGRESRAASFIVRRLREIKLAAPNQLTTAGDVAFPQPQYGDRWFWPAPEFGKVNDYYGAINGGQQYTLASQIDYVSSHMYFASLNLDHPGQLMSSDVWSAYHAMRLLGDYAAQAGKPLVAGEFGMNVVKDAVPNQSPPPITVAPQDIDALRAQYFDVVLSSEQNYGVQGFLVWGAMPELQLLPGQFAIEPSSYNPFANTAVHLMPPAGPDHYVVGTGPLWNLFHWNVADPLQPPVTEATATAVAVVTPSGTTSEPVLDFGGMYGFGGSPQGLISYVNPVTATMGCPPGYTGQWLLGTPNIDYPVGFCYRTHVTGRAPDYDFGGLFGWTGDEVRHITTIRPNPATGTTSCPSGFTDYGMWGTPGADYDMHMCLRPHDPNAAWKGFKFGGMFGVIDNNGTRVSSPNPATGYGNCPSQYFYSVPIIWNILTIELTGGDYPLGFCYADPD